MKTSYNPKIVNAYFKTFGIPAPQYEYVFHPKRKWRFDLAWPVLATPQEYPGSNLDALAIEVQGGIWVAGGHSRGAGMRKDWEKYNMAAVLGWRILYCEPKELTTKAFALVVKDALNA